MDENSEAWIVQELHRVLRNLMGTIGDTKINSLDHGASVERLGKNICNAGAEVAALGGRLKQLKRG